MSSYLGYLYCSKQAIKFHPWKHLKPAAARRIVHADITLITLALHCNIRQRALFCVGNIELVLVFVIFIGKVILHLIVDHDFALVVDAHMKVMIDANEIDLCKAHIGCQLRRGIHARARAKDFFGDIIAEIKIQRVFILK